MIFFHCGINYSSFYLLYPSVKYKSHTLLVLVRLYNNKEETHAHTKVRTQRQSLVVGFVEARLGSVQGTSRAYSRRQQQWLRVAAKFLILFFIISAEHYFNFACIL